MAWYFVSDHVEVRFHKAAISQGCEAAISTVETVTGCDLQRQNEGLQVEKNPPYQPWQNRR